MPSEGRWGWAGDARARYSVLAPADVSDLGFAWWVGPAAPPFSSFPLILLMAVGAVKSRTISVLSDVDDEENVKECHKLQTETDIKIAIDLF